MTDVRTHLSRLDKPLQYATRNDFANLAKLRDLESFVKHQIQALQFIAAANLDAHPVDEIGRNGPGIRRPDID